MFNYKFSCNECDHKLEFSNEYLEDKFPMYIPINMKNINEIIDKFKCSGCSKKNFILLDNNERVIFDMRSSVLCISCERHIPIPRLEAQTKSHLCITCVEEGEIVSIEKERLGRIFPEVPLKMKHIKHKRYIKTTTFFNEFRWFWYIISGADSIHPGFMSIGALQPRFIPNLFFICC